jgi:hypothetical protein
MWYAHCLFSCGKGVLCIARIQKALSRVSYSERHMCVSQAFT